MNSLDIKNKLGERIDTLVEGKENANTTIVFVSGFGTDKHETAGYFDDLTTALKHNFRIVRFDFSGYGRSEGKSENTSLGKEAGDLEIVLKEVKKKWQGQYYLFAQSRGSFVTSFLCPDGIEKTIFTAIPNSDTNFVIERFVEYFKKRKETKIDFDNISVLARSSGSLQKIGPDFWKSLKDFSPIKEVTKFSLKTNLLIIHTLQDEVVGTQFMKEYDQIPGVKTKYMNGDHSFRKPGDRKKLIKTVKEFFEST